MSAARHWLRFATLARQLSQAVLPRFGHKFSPHRFTLPQLAACVLLKEYRNWTGAASRRCWSSRRRCAARWG